MLIVYLINFKDMAKKEGKGSGSKKYGRNKRLRDQNMSKYVKGKITFEKYQKGNAKD